MILPILPKLKGNDGQQLFEPAFLEYLANMEFSCDIDAIPEGTAVFPHEASGQGKRPYHSMPNSGDSFIEYDQFPDINSH